MSTTLVSARAPRAKKEAAAGILASMGATTSDLINHAFCYVLEAKDLPRVKAPERRSWAAFESFLSESTLDVAWDPHEGEDFYKGALREGKQADYESLA